MIDHVGRTYLSGFPLRPRLVVRELDALEATARLHEGLKSSEVRWFLVVDLGTGDEHVEVGWHLDRMEPLA